MEEFQARFWEISGFNPQLWGAIDEATIPKNQLARFFLLNSENDIYSKHIQINFMIIN